MFLWDVLKKEQEVSKLQEKIINLEASLAILTCRNDELKYKYLENLRTLRFSQKANERYKRRIRKFREVFRQNGTEKEERLSNVKSIAGKLPK
jgi:hypothetical protein